METNLTCAICLQDYDTIARVPLKVGKCGHVICKHCVDKIFIANRGALCPFDKQPLGHPAKSLINFPRQVDLLRKVYLQKLGKEAKSDTQVAENADHIALEVAYNEGDPDKYINQKLDPSFIIWSWRGGYSIKLKEEVYASEAAMQNALKELEEVIKQGYGFYLTSISIKVKQDSYVEALLKTLNHLQSLLKVEFELTTNEGLLKEFFKSVTAVVSLEELIISCKGSNLTTFPENFEDISKALPALNLLIIDLSETGLSCIKSLNKGVQEFKELKHLELNLSGNHNISEEDLIDLTIAISKLSQITTISLNLKNLKGFTNKTLLDMKPALKSLANLTYLYLDLSNSNGLTFKNMLKFVDGEDSTTKLKIFTINIEGCGFSADMIRKLTNKLDELGDHVFTRIRPSGYEMNAIESKVPLGPISVLNIPLLIFALPVVLIYLPMIFATAIALCLQDKEPNSQHFAKVLVKFPYYFVVMLGRRFIGVCNLILRGKLFNREALLDICVDV